jgi:hypothetical protein
MAGDDWRVELDAETHGAQRLLESRHLHRIAKHVEERLGDAVRTSVDPHKLFVYAGDEGTARRAADVLEEQAGAEGITATLTTARWHPEEERWESPDVPMPETDAEHRAEHERLQESERQDSEQLKFPAWEVEVDLPSREATEALVRRLHAEGIPLTKRGDAVVLGTDTEDDAYALAERMRAEAPEATGVKAQGSEAAAWAQLHPYPFLGFGG